MLFSQDQGSRQLKQNKTRALQSAMRSEITGRPKRPGPKKCKFARILFMDGPQWQFFSIQNFDMVEKAHTGQLKPFDVRVEDGTIGGGGSDGTTCTAYFMASFWPTRKL